MRLLCTGDIHLGRRPSRIPDDVPDLQRFSTAAGWLAIVDLAIAERVDLLAISGDLVDLENRFYEALGPVEAGIRKLIAHGIPVVAVAGNHDFSTAPTFAERYGPGFKLIGPNQQWERHTIFDASGVPCLYIDGWSFAAEHVTEDPLATYSASRASDAPVLGLLHADLDATERRYAPVSLQRLRQMPVDCWLLGHIHVPRLRDEPGVAPVLYPGSPFPLDPGESGPHGVWMLDIEKDQPPRFTFRPIARHRYQPIAIDLTGIDRADHAAQRVTDELSALHESIRSSSDARGDGSKLEYLLARVTLTGNIPIGLDLTGEMELLQNTYRPSHGSVESIHHQTRPLVDLQAIAMETSPPGAVARILLGLRSEGEASPLVAIARQQADDLKRQSAYHDIGQDDEFDVISALETASWQLLDTLLAQRALSA